MEIHEIEIARLSLEPNDIVVLKLDDNMLLTYEDAICINEKMGEVFPDHKTMILHKADIKVVRNVLPVL